MEARTSLDCLGDPAPHGRLLWNGRYSVLITGAGTGYSLWNGYALTRWSADRTEDADGLFGYVRDLDRGKLWSLGHQPSRKPAETYRANYQPGSMRIERRDEGIYTRVEICVVPDDDIEIRRVTLQNLSNDVRRLELTSYAEVVLQYPAAHAAHPAFSKLFVETEYRDGILLARRRPRSHWEQPVWAVHALFGNGALEYETDRARFLGRGRTFVQPLALTSRAPLSGTVGNVLDPIFSQRRVAQLAAGESAQFTLLLGAALEREAALNSVRRYNEPPAIDAAFAHAAETERNCLRRSDISEEHAEYLQELAGAMLYGHPGLRGDPEAVARARGRLADLCKHGVGSDGLLVVAHVEHLDHCSMARALVQARGYWQTKGLRVDLLILCGEPSLTEEVTRELGAADVVIRRRADIPPADLDLIHAAAHMVVTGDLPALAREHAAAVATGERRTPRLHDGGGGGAVGPGAAPTQQPLLFSNGYGGFTPDGSEYVVHLDSAGRRPPMPWVNVVANESFGFLVSESGAPHTWSGNSHENRLTPWSNDPISDPYGEALYVRDDEAGTFWSPLPGPTPHGGHYEVRHGFGYSAWRSSSHGLEQEVVMFVPQRDPLKITRLRLTNAGHRTRQLSVFSYHRLVMGVLPSESGRFVVTQWDPDSDSLLAYNRLNADFSDRVAFAAAVAPQGAERVICTGDRASFIGRNGCPAEPAAVREMVDLDGRTGAGLDACAALQVRLRIPPGATVDCAVLLGEVADRTAARTLVAKYRHFGAVDGALQGARKFWARTLSAVRVQTPSPAIDLMVNGWLLYQAVSCRLWGRSAFYQSGGAFGFRDQLQDSAALIYARPDLTRAQIVLHAAHQFVEGDVLHWWHPPASRGTRTRFSDDLLWLPYITTCYVQATGDWSVFEESAGFITARFLEPGEDDAYLLPSPAGECADVYVHCCRAVDRSLTRGAHGLPLMGTGDWNDGMNRVGREGRGESVWLGFFLYRLLGQLISICERRHDHERVQRYHDYRAQLRTALNDAGWDGAWYRRAYYDDGTPLGSAQNEECRIDALAQAWAVLSGAAPHARCTQAMDAVEEQLVSQEAGLIRLLAPPFDCDPRDPGYIKGYVPGIRENGGQYTHAALWVVQALAELGRRDRAAAFLEMLSPIRHTRTAEDVAVYQVEPYVVAADVYGVSPHVGRGGWTWYTGAAGWMYRVAIESVLGLQLEAGKTLRLKPCIPDDWPQFRVTYRLPDGKTQYEIVVGNPSRKAEAVIAVSVDDEPGMIEKGAARIPLVADGQVHRVDVGLGAAA